MKHVYVGECPVCGAQRELTITETGHWAPRENMPPEWVAERVLLTAHCPRHQEDPGRSWRFAAGEEWQLTLKVEEDEGYADTGADGVPQGTGAGEA